MKKRIAVDMDEVIADVYHKFLDLYERDFGYRPKKEDYWGGKIYSTPEAQHLRNYLYDKGFFADLPVMKDSQAVLQALQKNYDIYLVTAAMEFRNSFEDKFDWAREHFSFIPWRNIVFCGDKSLIDTDYMIDDHVSNLETFKGKGLLYTSTHNIHEQRFTRVNNWKEVQAFFEKES